MKYKSLVVAGGEVTFPAFLAERVYMQEFHMAEGLPEHLKRWQPTVDQMMVGIDTDLPIYLMVDQAIVEANKAHRREGLHVDGYWNPGISAHSYGHTSTPSHRPAKSIHQSYPPSGHRSVPRHGPMGSHSASKTHDDWATATFDAPEALVLASDVSACMGFSGEFEGVIGEGGDCSGMNLSNLSSFILDPNRVYVGNVTFLHESIPVRETTKRTLVRLNVPGYTIQ